MLSDVVDEEGYETINKVSYRKQIAHQHSCHKNCDQGRGSRPSKNFPLIQFDHRAKFGCFSFRMRACKRSRKIWRHWSLAP